MATLRNTTVNGLLSVNGSIVVKTPDGQEINIGEEIVLLREALQALTQEIPEEEG